MSERRWNPQLREWTITATHRQDRTFLPPADFCPLCPTRPGHPPTEIERETYDIVVFQNRFPSLVPHPPEPAVEGTRSMPAAPALGECEVIVYTPVHDATLAGASLQRIRHLIGVWAHRTRELAARDGIAYVFVFENKGEVIGVTLNHPHGQVYAYPTIPSLIEREVAAGRAHDAETGHCLWCDLVSEESADGRREIFQTRSWQVVVPFFARWPYEVHLRPKRHVGWLHELDEGEIEDLSRGLKTLLLRYYALFGFSLPYIMAIHQRPVGPGHEGYHLHVEFLPPHRTERKLKYLAGSETAAGAFINDTLPEETAARLRALEPRDPYGPLEGAG